MKILKGVKENMNMRSKDMEDTSNPEEPLGNKKNNSPTSRPFPVVKPPWKFPALPEAGT